MSTDPTPSNPDAMKLRLRIQDVGQRIRALTRATLEQQTQALLWSAELCALCDRWVPQAPPLLVEYISSEHDISLGWVWRDKERSLTLTIDAQGQPDLMLGDGNLYHSEIPNHERLKHAVQSFFDGWTPPQQEIPWPV